MRIYRKVIHLFTPVILILLLVGVGATSDAGLNILHKAYSQNEITEWAGETYGLAKSQTIDTNDKKLLVVFGDVGFGTSRVVIYVYLYSPRSNYWDLILLRFTNTSEVNMKTDDDSISFYAQNGDLLLTQPLNSLQFDFDLENQ